MVFSVFGRRNNVQSGANALRTAVVVVVFTFVVCGIGVESAFAQQNGSGGRRISKKKNIVTEQPKIMGEDGPPPTKIDEGSGGGGYPYITPPIPWPVPPLMPAGGGTIGGYPAPPTVPGPPPPVVPPIDVPDRTQTVHCSCDVSVYSTPHPGHLENCPRSPTNHFFTRITYTSSVTLTTSQPDKSHSEVCSNGSMSGVQVIKRKRTTDYPQCGDDNSTYDYLPYGGERCSN